MPPKKKPEPDEGQRSLPGLFFKKTSRPTSEKEPGGLSPSTPTPRSRSQSSDQPEPSSSLETSSRSEDQPKSRPIDGKSVTVTSDEKKKRRFVSSWSSTFPWVIYDEERNVMFCSTCKDAGMKNSFTIGC